jgi:hypothetical protein
MTSISRNKSKSKKSKDNSRSQFDSDEKIDQIMKDITLKRPRNAYTQFVLNEVEIIKSKNKDIKIDIQNLSSSCAEKWKKMKDADKRKFTKIYEEEKVKYRSDIELVRHYLFKDFNDTIRSAPTAYRIYLNEKLRDGFEQGSDPKEVKKEATSSWMRMSEEEKKVYMDRKKENDNWFQKAEKIKKVNPIALFIQKKIEEAKEKHKEPPTLKEIAPAWKKLSKNEKKSYEKYAQEINEEKEKLQDIYEIVHGVKPKKPAGAFRIFLQEKAKNNEIKSLSDGHNLWKNLSEDEKEEYLTKSHRCQLAYKYKKMIYNKKIKKLVPKKPKGALYQFLKEKKGQKPANGENWLKYWRTVFSNLSNEQKKKYEDKAEKAIEKYEKQMAQFQDKIFDMPKKPVSGFSLYVCDRMPDLKKEKPNQSNQALIRIIAKEWMDGKNVDQNSYNKKAEKDKARFQKQLKEFQKLGYYYKSKSKEENDEEEIEVKKSKKSKRKSSSKATSQKTKKNRSSASKGKTQPAKSRSKSKRSQKVGRSQKSKK